MRPYLKKTHHKKGLVKWLKVSSSHSTAKKKKKTRRFSSLAGYCSIILANSGIRDQEDHGSKPALSKSFMKPYLKNTQHKIGLAE
jgi:hypothetical protein